MEDIKNTNANQILTSFDKELYRMYELGTGIKSRINELKAFEVSPSTNREDEKPIDFIGNVNNKIQLMSLHNDRLEEIYKHLNEII